MQADDHMRPLIGHESGRRRLYRPIEERVAIPNAVNRSARQAERLGDVAVILAGLSTSENDSPDFRGDRGVPHVSQSREAMGRSGTRSA